MIAKLEIITPEIAAEYLKKNIGNRPASSQIVLYYCCQMQAGQWQGKTGEAIKFDTDGILRDGQNRLSAIVKAAMPIEMLVVRGIDPGAFAVLDSGKMRSAGDVLAVAGHKNYSKKSTLAKAIITYQTSRRSTVLDSGGGRTNGLNTTSTAAILAFVEANDLSEHHRRSVAYNYQWRMLPVSTWAFLDWLFSRINAEAADNFLTMLSSGVNIPDEKHPVAFARKALTNAMAIAGTKAKPSYTYALIVTAWNHYRNRRQMRAFHHNPDAARVEPV